ncbi:hypothetical protein DPMN_022361 [Dreissena polymorpha]|uniref:Uncharacterized protein n=1 Tax=Dreissena polymorpha TaxID=45954 RepID=A0A9D4SCE0_DREPO|nr:hypothetical protein DPMN_022361 [Dreissena polymorpha]
MRLVQWYGALSKEDNEVCREGLQRQKEDQESRDILEQVCREVEIGACEDVLNVTVVVPSEWDEGSGAGETGAATSSLGVGKETIESDKEGVSVRTDMAGNAQNDAIERASSSRQSGRRNNEEETGGMRKDTCEAALDLRTVRVIKAVRPKCPPVSSSPSSISSSASSSESVKSDSSNTNKYMLDIIGGYFEEKQKGKE